MKNQKHLLLAIICIVSNSLFAQNMKIISGGEISFIQEFKGIVEFKDNKLVISSLNSPAAGENIDLKLEDEIMYVNGKRVKSLDAFNKNYENTPVGNDVKLGIKRAGELMITSFTKQDPKSFKHNVMRIEGPSDGGKMGKIEMKNGKIFMDGKEVDPDSLKAKGIMIKTNSDDK